MRDQVHKYQRPSLKQFDTKPEICPVCNHKRILQSPSGDAPFKNAVGRSYLCSKYVYMCCGCGEVIGFTNEQVSPQDIINAHDRPDLSAKYEACGI